MASLPKKDKGPIGKHKNAIIRLHYLCFLGSDFNRSIGVNLIKPNINYRELHMFRI